MTAPMLELHRAAAATAGIPEDDIDDLWVQHCAWCDQKKIQDYGGRAWTGLIFSAVAKLRETKSLTERQAKWAEERTRKSKLEAQRKAQADREYNAQAVSLTTWIEMLQNSEEPLKPHEQALVNAPPLGQIGDVAAWLLAVMATTKPVPREHNCACGLPAQRWVHDGRVYYAGQCVECAQGQTKPPAENSPNRYPSQSTSSLAFNAPRPAPSHAPFADWYSSTVDR